MDESDRQEYQSGNSSDRTTKRRSEKVARNQLFGSCGHLSK
jgi:hypothetical protein